MQDEYNIIASTNVFSGIIEINSININVSFQVNDVTQAVVESFPSGAESGTIGAIGHYTAVVWADTYQVGCGFMRTTDPTYKLQDVSKPLQYILSYIHITHESTVNVFQRYILINRSFFATMDRPETGKVNRCINRVSLEHNVRKEQPQLKRVCVHNKKFDQFS